MINYDSVASSTENAIARSIGFDLKEENACPTYPMLFKWVNPGLFFIYFMCFQSNNTIFTTITKIEKGPSSIGHQDSNALPLDYESHPITTKPGLTHN